MKYKYLPHTADAKFVAYGNNIDEVFENCAIAMFNILGKTSDVKLIKKFEIELKAKNYERLLYDFLEELLFLLETENLFLSNVKNLRIDKNFSLTCTIEGDNIQNYETNSDIKAITYSDMDIKETSEGYEATVVVDI
jgi:SHS2 domain-containing protein